MAIIPVKFKRVAAAFDEGARARLCGSSGTEHSGQISLTDLSDLVNSFFEGEEGAGQGSDAANKTDGSSEANCSDHEVKEALRRLFNWELSDDEVKRKIHTAVSKALREVSDVSALEFKRRLMVRLRHGGLDAGLCKCKWEKAGKNCPSGDYEYIDVDVSGTRYFVEVSLAKEFTIARPTGCYATLLNMFPEIFIGKQEELKQVTRLMCSAIKKSMKKRDIHVPPWRRVAYMQAKWFSSYKRTTNAAPGQKGSDDSEEELRRRKRSVGFVAAPVSAISFVCREDFSTKAGGARVGNLAAALNDNSIPS